MAGGQCPEQGPHGKAAGLWDQWQELLPLQGHHTHHVQAVLCECARLQGARSGRASDESWGELRPAAVGAHTPGQAGPMGTPGARAGPLFKQVPLPGCPPQPAVLLGLASFPRESSLTLQSGRGVLAWGSRPGPLYYSIICSLWYQEEGLAMYSSRCNE